MPRPPVDDPRWQAYRHVVKVRFNTEQLNLIDELCAEHGVSRSWLIRGALAKGLPHVFDELVKARAHGLSVRAPAPWTACDRYRRSAPTDSPSGGSRGRQRRRRPRRSAARGRCRPGSRGGRLVRLVAFSLAVRSHARGAIATVCVRVVRSAVPGRMRHGRVPSTACEY